MSKPPHQCQPLGPVCEPLPHQCGPIADKTTEAPTGVRPNQCGPIGFKDEQGKKKFWLGFAVGVVATLLVLWLTGRLAL